MRLIRRAPRSVRRLAPTALRLVVVLSVIASSWAVSSAIGTPAAQAVPTAGTLSQDGYLFENDNGTTANTNSSMAARNTPVTAAQGQRLTYRTQIRNVGSATTPQIGLFADRNDGYYSRVTAAERAAETTNASPCANDTKLACSVLDGTITSATNTSMAASSDGSVFVAYYDSSAKTLKLAHVTSNTGVSVAGGSCNPVACVTVKQIASGDVGYGNSITVDTNGRAAIAYWDRNNNQLRLAWQQGDGSFLDILQQTNVTLDATGDRTAILVDVNGSLRIAYHNTFGATNRLFVTRFVGSGGDCTDTPASGCVTPVYDGGGINPSLALGPDGTLWVAFQSNAGIIVGNSVGSGGNTTCTIGTSWSCTVITNSSVPGSQPTLAFGPNGLPSIAYWNNTANSLMFATNVAGTGCAGSGAWTCTTVDSNGASVGRSPALAFDVAGKAWIFYDDITNGRLKLARQFGTASCGGSGVAGWVCSNVQTGGPSGKSESRVVTDTDGNIRWAGVNSTGRLAAASIFGSGQIAIAPSAAATGGASLTTSHTDMTTATDSAAAASANCNSSGTWNNGALFQTTNGSGVTLPAGSSTAQCTEVAWVLDTAPATLGASFRFVSAVRDGGVDFAANLWRSIPSAVTGPQLTIAASASTMYSKDAVVQGTSTGAECQTGATCRFGLDRAEGSGWSGESSAVAIAPDGTAWVAFFSDYSVSSDVMNIAKYVGAGNGSGCKAGADNAWQCQEVYYRGHSMDYLEGGNEISSRIVLQFAADGTPWIATVDNNYTTVGSTTGTRYAVVARKVSAGATGCSLSTGGTSTAWSCDVAHSGNTIQPDFGMALDNSDRPWLTLAVGDSSTNNTYLMTAHPINGTGVNCSSTGWTCELVDGGTGSNGSTLRDSDIGFDAKNNLWIAYSVGSFGAAEKVRVASRVGAGGTGCSRSPMYNCADITQGAGPNVDIAYNVRLAFDANNAPAIAYAGRSGSSADTRVVGLARYVGGSNSSCAFSSTWSCEIAYSNGSWLAMRALAFDTQNRAVVNFADYPGSVTANVIAVRGGSGAACPGGTGWSCTTLTASGALAMAGVGSMAIDRSGTIWATVQRCATNHSWCALAIAKTSQSTTTLSTNGGDLRYHLDSGESPIGSCVAANQRRGLCGVQLHDGSDETVSATAWEAPTLAMATTSATNTAFPAVNFSGTSSLATSVSVPLTLDIYRFGTTNAWVQVATRTDCGANTVCALNSQVATGTASEYYTSINGTYRSYTRISQTASASAAVLRVNRFALNASPNVPTAAVQWNAADQPIATGAWIRGSEARFNALVTDPDFGDLNRFCVELKLTGNAFNGASANCGGPATQGNTAYTGYTGLADGAYHWQYNAVDSAGFFANGGTWTTFNSGNFAFGIDNVTPLAGTLRDGTGSTDAAQNNGTLNTLSANWSGFTDALSGVAQYEYSIGTAAGGTQTLGWKTAPGGSSATTFTESGLALRSNTTYFTNLRVTDSAGNTIVVSSDGQTVAPFIAFTLNTSTVGLGTVQPGNNAAGTVGFTVDTNAYGGYTIKQRATQQLTAGAQTVPAFASTYPAVALWNGGAYGFGYTVSTSNITGYGDLYSGATRYAGVSTGAGDTIYQRQPGTTGSNSFDNGTITYRLSPSGTQAPGNYRTTVQLTVTPTF